MRTIKIITVNGVTSEVTIDCGNKMVENSYDGFPLSPKLFSWQNINCVTKGTRHYLRDFHTKEDKEKIGICDHVKNLLMEESVYGTASGHRIDRETEYVILMLDEKNYKLLVEAIKEETMDNTTSEAKEYIKNKKESDRKRRINSAQAILEHAKSTIKLNGKLMTDIQAEEWKKVYNDKMNEGGEGYIPEIITVEAVEYAKRVLKELGE